MTTPAESTDRSSPNLLDDSDADDQLDAVLKEAARLAAQMRSVSGQEDDLAMEEAEDVEHQESNNNQVLLPPYTFTRSDLSLNTHEVPGLPPAINVPESHDDNTSMAGSTVTFDTFLNRGGTPSNASMVKKETADTPSSTFNDSHRQQDDVNAAIRASEEMAKVMAALGVPSHQPHEDTESSHQQHEPTSASQSLHSSQDATTRDLNNSTFVREPDDNDDDDQFSVPMKDYSSRHSEPSEKSAHHSKHTSANVDDYTPKKANNSMAHDHHVGQASKSVLSESQSHQILSSNLPSMAPSFAEAGAHTSPWKSYSAGIPLHQRRNTHESLATDLASAADDPSELTEPIFQNNASDAPSWIRGSKDSKDMEKRVESSLWQKVEDAQDGDDDFVPLRDYSHQTVTIRDYSAPKDARKSSQVNDDKKQQTTSKPTTNSGVQWDTLQEPSAYDDDYVPIRGLSPKRGSGGSKFGNALPYRNLNDNNGLRSNDLHSQSDPPRVIGEISQPASDNVIDNVPSFEEGADLRAMNDFKINAVASRKLRTPNDVRWEKMDYATEIDDDFVPLKDYSKASPSSPATSGSSTGTSTRGFTPFFASSSTAEYESIMSVYRSQDYDQEGPTAFELKRRKERRKKKIRRIKIAILALLFMGAVVFFYQKYTGLASSKGDSVATANYKNRRTAKAKAHFQRSTSRPNRKTPSSPTMDEDEEPTPSLSPEQQQHTSKEVLDDGENKDDKSHLEALETSDDVTEYPPSSELDEPSVQQGVKVFVENPPTPNEPIQAAPTRVTVTALNATLSSSDGKTIEKRMVQPGAGICLLPMAYFLVDKCHFADLEERKEELLQAMLD